MRSAAFFALTIFLLGSCEQFDVLITATTHEGTVYECAAPNGTTVEVCYLDDSADELGRLLGRTCDDPSRRWPWFVNKLNLGCAYDCPPPHIGCNAKNGCYCPQT